MTDLKKCAAVFSLVASSMLMGGCASSSAKNYSGSGDVLGMSHAGTQQQSTAPQNRVNTGGLWVMRKGAGIEARKCDTPDQWIDVKTPKGGQLNTYCFKEKDIDYLEDNDLITGLPIKNRRASAKGVIMGAFMHNAYVGVQQRGANKNSRIRIGANGREGVNVVSSLVDRGQYARDCFKQIIDNPDTIFGNSLPKSPRQLGTFANCQSELRIATAAYYMRDVKIKIGGNSSITFN